MTSGASGPVAFKTLLTDFADYFDRAPRGAALATLQNVGVRTGTPFASYLRALRVVVASAVEKGGPLAPSSAMAIELVRIRTAQQYPMLMPTLFPGDLATREKPYVTLASMWTAFNDLKHNMSPAIDGDAFASATRTSGSHAPPTVAVPAASTWSGFGSQQLLSTNQQARMTIQFRHNGSPSASLAVWIYIVPNETMRCPLLLGRDSWMRFHFRSYQTLSPQPDGRVFGELTLSIGDDHLGSAAAYMRDHASSNNVYHLVYDGLGVSLTDTPQLIPVNLVRRDGLPALNGHYMVDLPPAPGSSDPSERFVSSGRQLIPLTGYQDLERGDVLDTASSPLLRVPLEALTLHHAPTDVSALAESPTTPPPPSPTTASDSSDETPPGTPKQTRSQPARIISSPLEHCAAPYSPDRLRTRRPRLGSPRHRRPPRRLPSTRTFFRSLSWTMVSAPYDRLKSRCPREPSRFNRAPTGLTRSSPNK